MAKGKNIYAAQRCRNCNMIINTIWFKKAKLNAADLEFKKYCPCCRTRVDVSVKEIKKAS